MRRISTGAALAVALGIVSGCGYSQGDRALSGGGLGAAAGAAGSALTGGSPAAGAVVGGAAGAAAGALTDPEDINLGRPLWQR
ncbi:MAG: hypothetical protein ACQEUZ_04435 [Pseudomonadota bacterium]